MSFPTEADFALIKIGDGASTEVFSILCGMKTVGINATANTGDRFVRDCAKPGAVPIRRVRVTGKQLAITGSGLIDKAMVQKYQDALGKTKNYTVEAYQADGTDTGLLLGTFAAPFVMTDTNMSISTDSDSSAEVTLASDGVWTWTPVA